MAYNVISIKEHQKTCDTYLADPNNIASWIVNEYSQKKEKTGIQEFISIIGIKRQSKIDIPILSRGDRLNNRYGVL